MTPNFVSKLREALSYDPSTGIFKWKIGKPGRVLNKPLGTQIGIDSKNYKAHYLAWVYVYGKEPEFGIDHKDGDRTNNKIDNLRDVTQAWNTQNQRRARRDNKTSGLLGVYPNAGRWSSKIGVEGRQIYLGIFDEPEQAYKAYLVAKRLYHPGCLI